MCEFRLISLSTPRVLGSHSLAVFLLGSWVPFPGCFPFLGAWVPFPGCFPFWGSWVPFPGCFLFFSSSFNCSFVSVVANELSTAPPWIRAPSSLALTGTASSRGLCHLLTLCSLASFAWKRSPNPNESVQFLSCRGTTVIFLPAVLLPSCCFQHCSTCLCQLLSLLTTTSLCNHADSLQHLTLLMWFWPLSLLPFPFLEPLLSVVTRV